MKTENNHFDKLIECRWSPKLKEAGWTPVVNTFILNYHKLDISANEAMFLIHCFMYKWTVQKPYVSLHKVSIQMGKSRDTTQKYARTLEKKGYIRRELRIGLPSYIHLNPLIKVLELFVLYPDLDKKAMQNILKPYVKTHTKKEPLITTFRNVKSNNGLEHIGNSLMERHPIK